MAAWTENRKAALIIIGAVIMLGWIGLSLARPSTPWNRLITGDGKGYYAYLPALFIYQDPQFNFIKSYEKKYYTPESFYDFKKGVGDTSVNKYYSGTALLVSPFFMAAHVYTKATGGDADGYSSKYQYAVLFAALFYLGLGLWWLYLFLRHMSFSFASSIGAALLLAFGTNLFHYTIREPMMSHVYSFALICGFVLFTRRWFQGGNSLNLILMAVLLGLIIAVRPSNLIILGILPFLAGSWQVLKGGFVRMFNKPLVLVGAVLLFFIPFGIQSFLWHWQTGQWYVYSYGGEGFHFDKPHIYESLFSYRKGWFLWTPVAFLGITGLFWFLRDNSWRFYWAMGFFLIVAYVLSSWWQWYYGMSFGNRAFIDFLFLPAIGIGLWFYHLRKPSFLIGFVAICACLLLVNQVQAYQHRKYILRWDMMTRSDYWRVFMRTGEEYEGLFWPKAKVETPVLLRNPDRHFFFDFEEGGHLTGDAERLSEAGINRSFAARLDANHTFGPAWKVPLDSLHKGDSLIQASVWFSSGGKPSKSVLVIALKNKGEAVLWKEQNFSAVYQPGRKWNQAIIQAVLPDPLPMADEIQVFTWNHDTDEEIYLDDMQVDLFKHKYGKK
jgi:hypothetical protein